MPGPLAYVADASTSGTEAYRVELKRKVRVLVVSDDQRLRIEVGDSGPGLTDEQRARAFQRGWSTKTGAGAGRRPGGGMGRRQGH